MTTSGGRGGAFRSGPPRCGAAPDFFVSCPSRPRQRHQERLGPVTTSLPTRRAPGMRTCPYFAHAGVIFLAGRLTAGYLPTEREWARRRRRAPGRGLTPHGPFLAPLTP